MCHAAKLTIAGLAAALIAGTAIAQDKPHPAIGARKAVMQLYAFNLGQLGAMAKGEMDYDAATASAAADNLATLVQLNQSAMWPQGTDSDSTDASRALPAIWANFDDVSAKGKAMADAAMAMKEAAGTDLASLQGAMGALGGACSACHKAYRAPNN